jgi:hypothetical protein
MSFKHTPETDLRIRVGYSASEPVQSIADDLGVSKNVVIGRAGRIGLSGTYDQRVVRQRIGDANRGSRRSEKFPRPNMRAWWANRPADERADHIAKLRAGRMAKVNTAHKLKTEA